MAGFHFSLCAVCRSESGEGDARGKGPDNTRGGGGDLCASPGRRPPLPPQRGGQAQNGLRAAKVSPGAWLDRPRPGLQESRAGLPRSLGVSDATQCLALGKPLGSGQIYPCPLAPRLRRQETEEAARNKGGAALQRQITNTFTFFFFHVSGWPGNFGVQAAAGLQELPPRPPRRAGPGRMRGPGRRRPRPPAQPRSGRSPWQRARGGRGRARGPRRLLFLPLPVPRGHVAMATVLLTAAASRLGWRA